MTFRIERCKPLLKSKSDIASSVRHRPLDYIAGDSYPSIACLGGCRIRAHLYQFFTRAIRSFTRFRGIITGAPKSLVVKVSVGRRCGMRLSFVAVALVIFFSQTSFAQHSSAGSSSSGGGASSGGWSGGSSGGGYSGGSSRGGGSSGGGGASSGPTGGTSSGGTTLHGSGSSGSGRGEVWLHSPSGTPYAHDPAKTEPAHGNSPALAHERGLDFDSTAHGDSPADHDQLLDQALNKIQFELPANFKSEQLVSAKSLRPRLANPADLVQPREENQKKAVVPDIKPCRGRKCPSPSLPRCGVSSNGRCITGGNWRLSQQLYDTMQVDCGYLSRQLAREERTAAIRNGRRDKECLANPLGSGCLSATRAVDKSNAKISQLHDRYDRCVLQDLRHRASISTSAR